MKFLWNYLIYRVQRHSWRFLLSETENIVKGKFRLFFPITTLRLVKLVFLRFMPSIHSSFHPSQCNYLPYSWLFLLILWRSASTWLTAFLSLQLLSFSWAFLRSMWPLNFTHLPSPIQWISSHLHIIYNPLLFSGYHLSLGNLMALYTICMFMTPTYFSSSDLSSEIHTFIFNSLLAYSFTCLIIRHLKLNISKLSYFSFDPPLANSLHFSKWYH